MSSFEPLFTAPGRRRITPLVVRAQRATRGWLPETVAVEVPVEVSSLDHDFDADEPGHQEDSEAAAREAEAAAEAARIAEAAARQAEVDAAYLRGVSEGREQGEHAERARLRGAMLATESALDDLRAGEARWLHNLEENIAAIAVGVAQQVVQREVSMEPAVVRGIVTRALHEFGLDQPLTIRVHPGDHEALSAAARSGDVDELSTAVASREVRWVADARIEPGGCVVEGRERIVDGRVDTGLERLYRRLTHTHA